MEPHKTPEVNQASGNSIFWALVALALNAMTEPSRIGIFFRQPSGSATATNFNPGFDPLRSSPVLCAAETVLDMFFFIVEPKPQRTLSGTGTDATPNTPISQATEHQPVAGGQNPDGLSDPGLATTDHAQPNTDNAVSSRPTLKVVAFFLGVLPQAIKLFSMGGIVGTQICAAMFFAASVTRAISYKSPSHFATSLDVLKHIEIYVVPRLLLLLFTFIAHNVVYFWTYFNIAAALLKDAADAAGSDHSENILTELTTLAKTLYMSFGLLTFIFNLVWRRSVPLSKWFPLIVSVLLPDMKTLIRHANSGGGIYLHLLWLDKLSLAIWVIALSLIGSLHVSAVCIASGRVLSRLAAQRAALSSGHPGGSLPTTSTNANAPGFMGQFHFTITLRQGMVRLKAVIMSICKAVDNHGEWLGTWHEGFGMSTEHFVLACAIFNLLTALLYYLVVFDPTGTSSPLWTSVLG